MDFLAALWLPILLSAAAVWIASAIGWMVVGHHHNDWKPMPNEEQFSNALRTLAVPPGNYGFPHAEDCKKAMKDPAFQNRWKSGPTGLIMIWNTNVSMGKCMVLTMLVYIGISTLIAYLGWNALPHAGAGFLKAFQILGTAGVLAYAFAHIPGCIWFQSYPRTIVLSMIDGIIYGLITGAVFAALWPKGL